ncbi:MAG TPA: hypothetical protein VG032_07180 [Acidimicrobiales bacterium]|nr:hypothetical protein [Acidimicrobiales bacterium]
MRRWGIDRGKAQHILTSAGWIEGVPTKVTEGEFHVDDRAVAASDHVNFFVTGGDLLETAQYLWSEFDWVRLEHRSALGGGALNLHAEILDRSVDQNVLLGYLTNTELFVLAPINCRAERLLEVFVRAEVEVRK